MMACEESIDLVRHKKCEETVRNLNELEHSDQYPRTIQCHFAYCLYFATIYALCLVNFHVLPHDESALVSNLTNTSRLTIVKSLL